MRPQGVLVVLTLVLLLGACGLFVGGRDFPSPREGIIESGKTTKAELLRFFGEPYQVGLDSGDLTWSWFYVKKSSEGEISKDLTVRFDTKGVVTSYSFRSNHPEDMRRLK